MLLEEDGTEGFACDACRGLDTPLCLQVCREEDDLACILKKLTVLEPPNPGEKKSGGSCS
jgi:hypothetical protein